MRLKILESENRKQILVFAIGEFILIVLGILIALQIDNWNQNRQQKKLEYTILAEILLNLKSDLVDVDTTLAYNESVLKSNEIILNHMIDNKPFQDSLKPHFGNITGTSIFARNPSAFESLKSIGIDIISNDKLRQQITYLYSVQYEMIQAFQEFDHDFHIEYIFKDISEHIDVIQYLQEAVPIDYNELKRDNKVKQHLKLNIEYRKYALLQYNTAKTLIEKLINDIKIEIENY
jgi:hypothetical protein